MRAEEREQVAARLRLLAEEVGLELSPEQVATIVGRIEATVDGVRAGAELGLECVAPAFVPSIDGGQEP